MYGQIETDTDEEGVNVLRIFTTLYALQQV
jgi:hypothetical protein